MQLPCYSENKKLQPNTFHTIITLLYIESNKADLGLHKDQPHPHQNAETWTNPLIQRSKVFGLTYTLQISFTSTLSRTLTYLFCSVVLSVAKLLEHYYRINSKRYYFLPTKTDVSPACGECVIHDVLHTRHYRGDTIQIQR